jgi:hypothetical protein
MSTDIPDYVRVWMNQLKSDFYPLKDISDDLRSRNIQPEDVTLFADGDSTEPKIFP